MVAARNLRPTSSLEFPAHRRRSALPRVRPVGLDERWRWVFPDSSEVISIGGSRGKSPPPSVRAEKIVLEYIDVEALKKMKCDVNFCDLLYDL
ncbi:hypothetical protein GUJ93_ZPchr0010g8771 [Zizania palustris]|uniref:Uncharacterized protein n=1 Tax=Zizania palustris TaxID=103762 RepID=A0A8J5WG49_ZIZPA|nr:hypothetical protein GUJ93_ZPchr0010g8771 [Zizania palustris]